MATVSITQDLETICCYKCGITFAVPAYFKTKRLEDKESFWCPCGHSQAYYDENEADKLRKKLEAEQGRLAAEIARHDQTKAKARNLEKSLTAQKGQTTKYKRRAAHGVCPCCKRTFKQLAEHMKNKHPDFVDEQSPKAASHI